MIFVFLLVGSIAACQTETVSWQAINAEISDNFSDVEHISIEQFLEQQEKNDDVLIIDVREPEEYAVSHIPGAQNITEPEAIVKLALETEKAVVVYCSVGYRSAIMAKKLQALGVREVANLQGSIFAWANQSLPLVNQSGATCDVHDFNDHWSRLLKDDVSIKRNSNH